MDIDVSTNIKVMHLSIVKFNVSLYLIKRLPITNGKYEKDE